MKRLVTGLLSLSLLLGGCASTAPTSPPPSALFADERFAPPSEAVGA